MSKVEIPEAVVRTLLCDYDTTTVNMVGEYNRAKQNMEKEKQGELRDGLLRMVRFTILQRIDFLLQYKHVYSSGQNWEQTRDYLLKN